MRRAGPVMMVVLWGWMGIAAAADKPIRELPKDVIDLAFVWTKPITQIAKRSLQSGPVSGVWFGLLEGSVQSVERTTQILVFQEGAATPPTQEPGKIFRYSF